MAFVRSPLSGVAAALEADGALASGAAGLAEGVLMLAVFQSLAAAAATLQDEPWLPLEALKTKE